MSAATDETGRWIGLAGTAGAALFAARVILGFQRSVVHEQRLELVDARKRIDELEDEIDEIRQESQLCERRYSALIATLADRGIAVPDVT